MNIDEVPQDSLDFKGRDKVRKLLYAVDGTGRYSGVVSSGWDAEHVAMQQAWEDVDAELKATEELVRSGALSPIAYFMQKNLMTPALLAGYTGKWQWQVRRHMKPSVFRKLSVRMLQCYAAIFKITQDELTSFGSDKA